MKILVLASASVLAFATPAFAQSNVSVIDQVGSQNAATLYQGTDNNASFIEQVSSNDTALVDQNGGDNVSFVKQSATEFVSGGNNAEIRMSGTDSLNITNQAGQGNYANVTFSPAQTGGLSLVSQDGARNRAIVANGDEGNVSIISQTFDDNYANVYQDGYNNLSSVTQNGAFNTANVTQH